MARFRGIIEGQRGPASRLGRAKSGLIVKCNSWHSGVTVDTWVDEDDRDVFDIYVTDGSGGNGKTYIGRLVGKTFEPNKQEAHT